MLITTTTSRGHSEIFFSEKIRLDISCESSANTDDSLEISGFIISEK